MVWTVLVGRGAVSIDPGQSSIRFMVKGRTLACTLVPFPFPFLALAFPPLLLLPPLLLPPSHPQASHSVLDRGDACVKFCGEVGYWRRHRNWLGCGAGMGRVGDSVRVDINVAECACHRSRSQSQSHRPQTPSCPVFSSVSSAVSPQPVGAQPRFKDQESSCSSLVGGRQGRLFQ
jgi:hypothetical protein